MQPCALGSWVQPQPQQRFLRSLSAWIVSSGHSDTNSCASHLLRKWLVIQFWSMRNRRVFSRPCWESFLMLTRSDVWEHATILKPCSELAKVLRMAFLLFIIKIILNLRFGIHYLSNIYHGKKKHVFFVILTFLSSAVLNMFTMLWSRSPELSVLQIWNFIFNKLALPLPPSPRPWQPLWKFFFLISCN